MCEDVGILVFADDTVLCTFMYRKLHHVDGNALKYIPLVFPDTLKSTL